MSSDLTNLKGERKLSILCISPYAPPLNHAEPIQVGRYLQKLLETDRIKLVTEKPAGTWSIVDPSLEIESEHLKRKEIRLPFHSFTSRLLGQPALDLLRPWLEHWPDLFARSILKWAEPFDLIYSRSMPPRGALLAAHLKKLSGKPWIMHLSDPWADGAFSLRAKWLNAISHREELRCFEAADAIALTTEEQSEFYKIKYPKFQNKIFVSPNVFQSGAKRERLKVMVGAQLRVIYTGALYGERSPQPLIDAISDLPRSEQERVHFIIAGNATPDIIRTIKAADLPNVDFLGPISFSDASKLQRSADLLVTIEDAQARKLAGTFLLSKILDYLPLGIPILSITPLPSVTSKIIDRRYGWAIAPDDRRGMTEILHKLLARQGQSQLDTFLDNLPQDLQVDLVVDTLRQRMQELVRIRAHSVTKTNSHCDP